MSPPAALTRSGRPGAPLGLAAACLVGLALVWVGGAFIPTLHHDDAVVLQAFTKLERPRLDHLATSLTRLLDPLPFIVCGVALVLVGLTRRLQRIALAAGAIMVLAPLTSEVLKPLLAHPHASIGLGPRPPAASYPSGHTTAALTVALCAALVAPRRFRAAVALLGGAFVIAIGCSQLILGRHMPSDVLGGYLVAMFWTAFAVAVMWAVELHRAPERRLDRCES